MVSFTPSSPEAYDLFHQGAITLAEISSNGMRVDLDRLHSKLEQVARDTKEIERELKKDKVYKRWQRRKGEKINLDSRKQLADVIFGDLGYEVKKYTEKTQDLEEDERRPAADIQAFEHVDLPFIKLYFKRDKLQTAKKKLREIQREIVNGFLHPVFNLHTAITYRGSCELPNFQNIPVRMQELAEMIRSCFLPRDGHQIIETDFKGIEVCVAYCYHKDRTMRQYLLDKSKDMHRDMAAQIYMLEDADKDWWKDKSATGGDRVRYCGKNKFVFPQFYGSFYVDCARNLWDAIWQMSLTDPSGRSLTKHLKKHGIKELGECDEEQKPKRGTFEYHLQQVEQDFWKRRFKDYDKWKRRWFDLYQERGWFELKTGFVIKGKLRRNQVINFPVQGAAFHCLLWVLIQLQKWLKKNKMKTIIIGQIHDSIIADVHCSEREDYLAKVKELVTESLRKHWDWIIIPMEIEAEVCPPGESWYKKEKVDI